MSDDSQKNESSVPPLSGGDSGLYQFAEDARYEMSHWGDTPFSRKMIEIYQGAVDFLKCPFNFCSDDVDDLSQYDLVVPLGKGGMDNPDTFVFVASDGQGKIVTVSEDVLKQHEQSLDTNVRTLTDLVLYSEELADVVAVGGANTIMDYYVQWYAQGAGNPRLPFDPEDPAGTAKGEHLQNISGILGNMIAHMHGQLGGTFAEGESVPDDITDAHRIMTGAKEEVDNALQMQGYLNQIVEKSNILPSAQAQRVRDVIHNGALSAPVQDDGQATENPVFTTGTAIKI